MNLIILDDLIFIKRKLKTDPIKVSAGTDTVIFDWIRILINPIIITDWIWIFRKVGSGPVIFGWIRIFIFALAISLPMAYNHGRLGMKGCSTARMEYTQG